MAQTVDPEGTVAQLTRVILRDLGLTAQVLRVVNSPMYNRSGKAILSVPHAVALLGWETIQQVVSAMRFVEHFARESPGLRELMMMSLITANHGREVAATIGYPRPEEAYICALFRNLGEVLIARFQPRDYSRILARIQKDKVSEQAASLEVLGFTWQELAERLAKAWNLPRQVGMAAGPPERASFANLLDRCLISISDYGHALTTALYRLSGRLESVQSTAVMDPFGRPCLIPLRDLHVIADAAVENTQQTFSVLQIPLNTLKLEKQVQAAKQILAEIPAELTADGQKTQSADAECQTIAAPAQDVDVTAFIMQLLASLAGWGGFRRAVFALLNEKRDSVRARLGAGEGVEAVLSQFQFSMQSPDMPIAATLLRRQNLLVSRAVDGRYDRSELVARFAPAVFALFPIVVDGTVAGCIYADRNEPWSLIPDTTRVQLNSVRELVAGALRRVRSSSNIEQRFLP